MMGNRFIITFFILISLVIGSAAWAQETPTSPCLGSPSASTAFWKERFSPPAFNAADGFNNPSKDCPKVCKKWVKTCKGISDTAAQCFISSYRNLAKLERAECRTIADPEAKEACIEGVNQDNQNFNEQVRDDKQAANAFCRSEREDCVTQCLADTET